MPAKVSYGGQAVIEGVMMRGPTRLAIAVRRPNQEIITQAEDLRPWARRNRFFGLPIVRGVVALAEALSLGINALMFSANQALEDEGEQLSRTEMNLTVTVAVVFALLIFVVVPTLLLGYLKRSLGNLLLANLVEGLIRVTFLVAYVAAISRFRDIQRVLQYHGAEHKVIHTFERGLPLDVAHARGQSRLHPRCGTSFLLFVMLVSVLIFSFVGWPNLVARILSRLALMPLVAGVSYEVLRLTGQLRSPWLAWVTWPGLWLQRFTTREPDDSMLEVAIAAFDGARDRSGAAEEAPIW